MILQDQNVFDSKKKVKLMSADGVEYKLAKKQLQAIEFNKALLSMYTNQVHTDYVTDYITTLHLLELKFSIQH